MDRILIFSVLAVLFFSSCVPNRKLVYLQSENELNQDFPTDTVLRSYDLVNYEYRIQSEDILSIRIESLTEDEYNIFANLQQGTGGGANQNNLAIGGYLVDRNGEIQFPEVGKVKISGLTLHQTEERITEIATRFLSAPAVKVRLLNYRISVLGEVNREGVFNSINNRVTIMEVIAGTGGLSEMADRSKVKVIRQKANTSEVFYVNLLEEDYMKHSSFFVHPNDVIIVPPLKQRPFRRYFGQNLSLFVSTVSVILLTLNLLKN
ncbi:polysaccharide biosynthesis/export family protein [Fulvivirga sp.]|uniref:polysaccharide biosynthesis/export family protein n=1 Tax=Fulvivirga sp. TaxID=1931237 RepID=UPI0032EF5ADC